MGTVTILAAHINAPAAERLITIAPDGHWGITCTGEDCATPYAIRDNLDPHTLTYYRHLYFCAAGHPAPRLRQEPELLPDDAPLTSNDDTVRAREWFHATSGQITTIDPNTPMHVGSLEAARIRALHLRTFHRDQPVTIYRVDVNPETLIDPIIYIERDGDNTTDATLPNPADNRPSAARYINVREAPGSLSLILRHGAIAKITPIDTIQPAPPGSLNPPQPRPATGWNFEDDLTAAQQPHCTECHTVLQTTTTGYHCNTCNLNYLPTYTG